MRQLIIGLGIAALAAGCGGKGGSAGTPEETGKALVAAMNAKDATAIKALFPTKAQLDAALECKDGEGPWDKVETELGRVDKNIGELDSASVEWVGLDPTRMEEKKLATGEEFNGCKAKVDVTLLKTRFKVKLSKGGQIDDEDLGVTLFKAGDGGWTLIDM